MAASVFTFLPSSESVYSLGDISSTVYSFGGVNILGYTLPLGGYGFAAYGLANECFFGVLPASSTYVAPLTTSYSWNGLIADIAPVRESFAGGTVLGATAALGAVDLGINGGIMSGCFFISASATPSGNPGSARARKKVVKFNCHDECLWDREKILAWLFGVDFNVRESEIQSLKFRRTVDQFTKSAGMSGLGDDGRVYLPPSKSPTSPALMGIRRERNVVPRLGQQLVQYGFTNLTVENTDILVASYTVPLSMDASIASVLFQWTGTGFNESSGDITFRVRTGNVWMKGYGSITTTLGSFAGGYCPLPAPYGVHGGRSVELWYRLASGALSRLASGKIVMGVSGWLFPRRRMKWSEL